MRNTAFPYVTDKLCYIMIIGVPRLGTRTFRKLLTCFSHNVNRSIRIRNTDQVVRSLTYDHMSKRLDLTWVRIQMVTSSG
jgi:hypothetical protein